MFRRELIAAVVLAATLSAPVLAGGRSAPQEFSSAVASSLLEQLTRGFITNNQKQVLSSFDAARMKNYAQFRASIEALFAQYDSFRAAYRLLQSWPQGKRGVVIAEFELEARPVEEGTQPLHRSAQLRFEFEYGRAGWRIVDIAPRRFFS